MKASYKAALLSSFVFPGVGQLYLKRYWRDLFIILIVFIGLGYIIWSETLAALSVLDDAIIKLHAGTTNLQELSKNAGSKILTTDPYYNIVLSFVVCFWIFAIIDAYIIGKEREVQNEKTSHL